MRGMRRSAFSGGVVALLLLCAVLLGYATDMVLTRIEHYYYPMTFSETVTACADEYDLDPHTVYAMIKVLSNFTSNRVSEDGKIGLMQLSEETFLWLTNEKLKENLDAGLLYEPSTNIRYGCYYLLYLTTRYDTWEAVFAAYLCGVDVVDPWYEEWRFLSEDGISEFTIPNADVRKDVNKIQRIVDKYQELYKQKGDQTS